MVCCDKERLVYFAAVICLFIFAVLTFVSSFYIGGIIVYFKSTGNNIQFPLEYSHSAIIISKIYGSSTVVSFNLRSKWGPAGLYDHTMENCPYYYYPEGSYNVADRMYYNP